MLPQRRQAGGSAARCAVCLLSCLAAMCAEAMQLAICKSSRQPQSIGKSDTSPWELRSPLQDIFHKAFLDPLSRMLTLYLCVFGFSA